MQLLDSKTQNDYVRSSANGDSQYHREMQTVGASWIADWTDRWRSTLSLNTSKDQYTLKPSEKQTKTRLDNLLWHNEFKLAPGHKLSAAYERRNDSLINPSVQKSEKQTRHQDAIALGYGLTVGAHTLQLNARHDKDSEFGGKSTGSAAYAWNFTPQWRVSASMGTAFRVPTLDQRFSDSGDARLKPEESRNQELGLRWAQGDNQFSATVYRNKFTNMVTSTRYPIPSTRPCGSEYCYENVDKAQLEGLTLAGAYRSGAFKWHGSVDFQNPRNEKTGNMLARRSQRYAMLGVDTELQGWTLGAEMQSFSRRHDKEGDAKILAGYTLFNLSASRQIARDFTLTARVDNLMDRDYALAKGYATAGRTLYMGLKWMPQ
jgi:vitamin B12 transporter